MCDYTLSAWSSICLLFIGKVLVVVFVLDVVQIAAKIKRSENRGFKLLVIFRRPVHVILEKRLIL